VVVVIVVDSVTASAEDEELVPPTAAAPHSWQKASLWAMPLPQLVQYLSAVLLSQAANKNNITTIDSGLVMKEGNQVATFTMYSNSLTPSFQNVTDPAEMCEILMAISSFIGEVKKEVETNPIAL
jgi:hypothetical protein